MTTSAISSMLGSITTTLAPFSYNKVLQVISYSLPAVIALLLTWFAFRWIFGKIKAAFYFGK